MRGTKRAEVSLSGHAVGELLQTRDGLVQWVPASAWDANQVPRLGLDFLRERGPRAHASALPAWFENLLPERDSSLRRRLAAAHGLGEGQSYELLRALGRDLIGAVEVAGAASDEHSAGTDPGARSDGRLRMSGLTGLQLKFSMSMVKERLAISAHSAGARYIVKLPGTKYPELAEVEAATMSWAKRAGFAVPEHFAVAYDKLDGIPDGWFDDAGRDGPALAIKRFDRRDDGTKVHQEDLCQALAIPPADKYGNNVPRVTTEGALRLVTDACGQEEGREMARRIGFVIASGNGDAHLKNWSLLWGDRLKPVLTPCYDLVATVSWHDDLGWNRKGGPELALRFGGVDRFAQVDAIRLDTFAESVGHDWARTEVLAGIEAARSTLDSSSMPERMRVALDAHWERVPLLRR